MTLFHCILLGLLDRLRGSGDDIVFGRELPGTLWAAGMGLVVATMFGHTFDWAALVITLGVIFGARPGWGAPIGQVKGQPDPDREPERYQQWFGGFLWRHPWAALVFRGALWGIHTLPALYWDSRVWMIVVAFAAAMPLAEWLHLKFGEPPRPRSWHGAWNEAYRGALVGLILTVLLA